MVHQYQVTGIQRDLQLRLDLFGVPRHTAGHN